MDIFDGSRNAIFDSMKKKMCTERERIKCSKFSITLSACETYNYTVIIEVFRQAAFATGAARANAKIAKIIHIVLGVDGQ